ncbi:GNAT family N-acetyltransferase [Candidatus Xianfuyuplasma coldseepsis]|uniref:GNAT family N-acetyltransferase n=1 Tax=Candidatus Xianfuyuplasma coldseepsis TaxID=2782163 RepID=A0A7L7KS32_9MOLU|nr:GNAT family N-acetyltransferase [Xianfuyuplasma coldseepsis]QMS85527.1 GNAT family N-acetyltransferase [Xianfuyuplasma coldseepsis]
MKTVLKNGTEIVIRQAEPEDAKAIVETMALIISQTKNLGREPDEWNKTVEEETAILNRFKDSVDDYMAVADDDGHIVAVASFHGRPLKRLRHRVNLGISILKAYHHQGLGTALMKHLLQQAKRMGKHTVELEVRADNVHAIELYKKVGFVIEGVKKQGFYVDGDYIDELMMAYYMEDNL